MTIGPLQLNQSQRNEFRHIPEPSSFEYLRTGSNYDGWWTTDKLLKQIKEKAIPIFEATHPGCTALFALIMQLVMLHLQMML
jgi:hypothetical protein